MNLDKKPLESKPSPPSLEQELLKELGDMLVTVDDTVKSGDSIPAKMAEEMRKQLCYWLGKIEERGTILVSFDELGGVLITNPTDCRVVVRDYATAEERISHGDSDRDDMVRLKFDKDEHGYFEHVG